MYDSSVTVAPLHGEVEFSELRIGDIRSVIKVDALIHKPVDHFSAVAHREANGWLVAQAGSCDQRVTNVGVDRVPVMEYRGHSALGPEGRAGCKIPF